MSVDRLLLKDSAASPWQSCLEGIRTDVSDQQFSTWIESIQFLREESGVVHLGLPNEFSINWVSRHFRDIILKHASSSFAKVNDLQFSVFSESSVSEVSPRPTSVELSAFQAPPISVESVVKPNPHVVAQSLSDFKPVAKIDTNVNNHYSFNSFVEGDNNRMVLAAAKSVAQNPNQNNYNPLIIYGGTGLGKTHLLHAIGNFSLKNKTARKIKYRTANDFLNEFMQYVNDIRNKKEDIVDFNKKYSDLDILLIDDIQFLKGKKQTQEAFFNIFEVLKSMNRQIVITCDKAPSEIKGLHERLLNRFDSGLVFDVASPNFETRLNILKYKASMDPNMRHFPVEVLNYVAENFGSNIRELEGILAKLFAYSSFMGKSITLDVAKAVLLGTVKKNKGMLSIENIIDSVGYEFELEPSVLCSQSRLKRVSLPRKVAMYLARHLTGSTLHTIAIHFHRDYSTVIASIKSLEKLLLKDQELNERLEKIKQFLNKQYR